MLPGDIPLPRLAPTPHPSTRGRGSARQEWGDPWWPPPLHARRRRRSCTAPARFRGSRRRPPLHAATSQATPSEWALSNAGRRSESPENSTTTSNCSSAAPNARSKARTTSVPCAASRRRSSPRAECQIQGEDHIDLLCCVSPAITAESRMPDPRRGAHRSPSRGACRSGSRAVGCRPRRTVRRCRHFAASGHTRLFSMPAPLRQAMRLRARRSWCGRTTIASGGRLRPLLQRLRARRSWCGRRRRCRWETLGY